MKLPRRFFTSLVAKQLTPIKKTDPAAKIPIVFDGKRVFPPTVDEAGNVTYYYEFPNEWKPYSLNYVGHGWMIALQAVMWGSILLYDDRMKQWTEKERDL